MTTTALSELLAPYGAAADTVLSLDGPLDARAHLDYADLLQHADDRPDGVVRVEQATVAYILRGARPIEPGRILAMRRMLAQRDDGSCLVVVEPGRLAIYGVDIDRLGAEAALLDAIELHHAAAPATFRRLHQKQPARERAIHELLFGLMTTAIDGLHEAHGLSRSDAIALSGRALFMRFLLDRGVIGGRRKAPGRIAPGATDFPQIFSTSDRARATSRWLDATFNGDFLPVSEGVFDDIPRSALDLLEDIMSRTRQDRLPFTPVATDLETPFAWDELDFAHIPVGVLSQVYEYQAARWNPQQRQDDSVYYTPRRIAEYMVREAFARLEAQPNAVPHGARVLDPAVGGGVFLVAAFRELVAAWHRHEGVWPSSRELRRILFGQLTGFDIQGFALSLTSLSLYLTAIELDRPPYRFADLRFDRPLRGTVLFDVADPDDPTGPGSLGPAVGPEHDGRYDVVIANPPWTNLRGRHGKRVIEVATDRIRPVVAARLGDDRAGEFQFPDQVPDLPFVWRAMQWARSGGVMAFAVHARLLFKTSAVGQRARQDLFDAATVWGVLNGADLRMTQVWPEVLQPFCLVFADNAAPSPDHAFYMASPYFEPGLNDGGRLRVDPDAIHPITSPALARQPALLKALFRGTALDVQVLDRIASMALPSLADWWSAAGLATGDGFQTSSDRMDASHMLGRPVLSTRDRPGLSIDPQRLEVFARPRLHRTRDPAIYEGPLLVLRESVRVGARRVHVSDAGILFNESFYGFSAQGHPAGRTLVRYLALLLSSRLFEWFNLVTGGKFGVEREVWHKVDVDAFPLMPLDRLSPEHEQAIEPLFDGLAAGTLARDRLDAWVMGVYGLGGRTAEVIADTLAVGLPHQGSMAYAAGIPEPAMIDAFAARLGERLAPFAEVPVRVLRSAPGDPYRALLIGGPVGAAEPLPESARAVLEMADRGGSSECIIASDDGRVWLARLAQRRYWTLSRSRLTAARLIDDLLVGGA